MAWKVSLHDLVEFVVNFISYLGVSWELFIIMVRGMIIEWDDPKRNPFMRSSIFETSGWRKSNIVKTNILFSKITIIILTIYSIPLNWIVFSFHILQPALNMYILNFIVKADLFFVPNFPYSLSVRLIIYYEM